MKKTMTTMKMMRMRMRSLKTRKKTEMMQKTPMIPTQTQIWASTLTPIPN